MEVTRRPEVPGARPIGAGASLAHCRQAPAPLLSWRAMTFLEVVAVLAAAGALALLWTSLQAREAANAAMRAACRAEGLLFLDDTVALESMRPARDREGRMALRRVYGFEYSDTGDNRRKGSVTMLGSRILAVDMGPPTDDPQGADFPRTVPRDPTTSA